MATETKFSNELTDAQAERLAILLEEMGEAQQIIGKILRHGYESCNPHGDDRLLNRQMLMRELGDVRLAIDMLCAAGDLSADTIMLRRDNKLTRIRPYLHHQ